MRYRINLHNGFADSAEAAAQLEHTYGSALATALGGADQVAPAYLAYQELLRKHRSLPRDDIPPADQEAVGRWLSAEEAAWEAVGPIEAFGTQGDGFETFFAIETLPQLTEGEWLDRCVQHLVNRCPDRDTTTRIAQREAADLWSAVGQRLSPEEAADQWHGLVDPCDAVEGVIATPRFDEDEEHDHHPSPHEFTEGAADRPR